MTIKRWSTRRDPNEPEIVYALKWAGAKVERLDQPCDLLVRYGGKFHLLEVTHPGRAPRSKKQRDKLVELNIPIVSNITEALQAIGVTCDAT